MHSNKRLWAVLVSAAFYFMASAIAAPAQEINTGEALLRAMHDRYQHDWYETLTFTQQSITHHPDGPPAARPGMRR